MLGRLLKIAGFGLYLIVATVILLLLLLYAFSSIPPRIDANTTTLLGLLLASSLLPFASYVAIELPGIKITIQDLNRRLGQIQDMLKASLRVSKY